MKPRKHKHKESFSILLISNTGQNSRQFHVSRIFLRLFTVFVVVLCVSFGWLIYQSWFGVESGAAVGIAGGNENVGDGDASEEQKELLAKLSAQEKMVAQLEEEKESLSRQNAALTSENKALLAVAKGNLETENATKDQTEDTAYPSRYPYSEQGIVAEKYSAEHPYVSIDTEGVGNIIAAGDGTVSKVGSDDTYPLIIEIEHGNGYQTRYMFLQDADAMQAEGAQVQIGTALAAVDTDNVQVDYQVIFEGQPIDPLIVFEAKG